MTVAKRRLGRGLEALLVEVPVMSSALESNVDNTHDVKPKRKVPLAGEAPSPKLSQHVARLQKERRALLQEAEELSQFLTLFMTNQT